MIFDAPFCTFLLSVMVLHVSDIWLIEILPPICLVYACDSSGEFHIRSEVAYGLVPWSLLLLCLQQWVLAASCIFRLACRAVWKLIKFFTYTWREKCSAVQSPLLMTGWLPEFSLSKEGSTVGCILAKKWASIIVPVNWEKFWILSKKHSCAIRSWVARQRQYPFSGPHIMDATNYRKAGS